MAALTSAALVVLFACSWIFVLCQGTQELKVTAGMNATLPCWSQRGAAIEVIKWIRPDLKSDGYVFVHRDDPSNENLQHPSYRGRVELRDPERKNGDASVILKNVNINDTGTYECRIKNREEKEKKKATLINTIILTVTEPGHTAGHEEGGDKEGGDQEGGDQEENVGLKIGLPIGVIILLGVGGGLAYYLIFIKCRGCRANHLQQPPANEAEMQNLHKEQSRDNNSDQPAAPENVPMQAAEPADENQ